VAVEGAEQLLGAVGGKVAAEDESAGQEGEITVTGHAASLRSGFGHTAYPLRVVPL
jgi:hypothetical protein